MKPTDEERKALIYDGVSVSTLGLIFGLHNTEVAKRLTGRVTPVPSKDSYTRYRIRDAAPYLCDLQLDPEEMLKKLSPSKLPPMLQDAFWKAQLSRLKYLQLKGELWSTARVFDVISGAFKVIRLTILMFVDTVEQRTQLSDEQRRIVQELGDGLLASLEKALEDEFRGYVPPDDEHGPPITDPIVGRAEGTTDEQEPALATSDYDPFD